MDPSYLHDVSRDAETGALLDEMCRALVEYARDIVLLMHRDGSIVLANDAAEKAYGYSREELASMSIVDLRAPDSQRHVPDQLATAADSGALFETEHRSRDGRIFPVEVSSRGVEIGGGPYLLSVIRDISARVDRMQERERLLGELEVAYRQLEGLLEVVSTAVGRVDLDGLLGDVMGALNNIMLADGTLFFVAEGQELVLRAYHGFDRRAEGFSMGINEGFAGKVAAAGEPLWTSDVTSDASSVSMHQMYGLKSMYGIPLYLDGALYGVLECAWTSQRLVNQAEEIMLRVAADRIMAAVAGAQRYERTARAQRLDAALHHAADRLNASHDLAVTVPAALQVACEALDCDVAAFGNYDNGAWEVVHGIGLHPGVLVRVPEHPARSRANRESLPVVRINATGPSAQWLSSALGLSEAVVVPVQLGGEWMGALLFGRNRFGGGFDEPASEFARRLSTSFSLAFANSREFDAEHRIAETLQEALLRLDHQIDGVSLGYLYRSATSATKVGGDFYDVFGLGEGRIGVIVGDVSGKGLDAAVFTTLVKHTVRAFAHTESSPAVAVSKANQVLSQAARLPDFASLVLMYVDTHTGKVCYCCAGHPPVLIRRADGSMEHLSCGSPVVGVSADLEFKESAVSLDPSDVVVLYTDGVTEARVQSGEFFGDEKLAETVSRCTETAEEMPAAIYAAVKDFAGGQLNDDIAIVAFSIHGD